MTGEQVAQALAGLFLLAMAGLLIGTGVVGLIWHVARPRKNEG